MGKGKRSNPICQGVEGSANVMYNHDGRDKENKQNGKVSKAPQLSAGQCREIIYNDKISDNYCYA